MGGELSKNLKLDRQSSFRHSKTKRTQNLKQRLEKLENDYRSLTCADKNIRMRIFHLENDINSLDEEYKVKNRKSFEQYLTRCQKLQQDYEQFFEDNGNDNQSELQETIEDAEDNRSKQNVELEQIQEALNHKAEKIKNNTIKNAAKKNKERKQLKDKTVKFINEDGTKMLTQEQESMKQIETYRKEIVDFENEIDEHPDGISERHKHYLEETFLRLLRKLETVQTFEHKQINYERISAMNHAKECIKRLDPYAFSPSRQMSPDLVPIHLSKSIEIIELPKSIRDNQNTSNINISNNVIDMKNQDDVIENISDGKQVAAEGVIRKRIVRFSETDENIPDDVDNSFSKPLNTDFHDNGMENNIKMEKQFTDLKENRVDSNSSIDSEYRAILENLNFSPDKETRKGQLVIMTSI